MLLDANDIHLIVGRKIVSTIEAQLLREAVLAYFGLYYLLDFDYPPSLELGFTLCHYFFFEDKTTPVELVKPFNAAFSDFQKFQKCNEWQFVTCVPYL